jgi:hypothetical protein
VLYNEAKRTRIKKSRLVSYAGTALLADPIAHRKKLKLPMTCNKRKTTHGKILLQDILFVIRLALILINIADAAAVSRRKSSDK